MNSAKYTSPPDTPAIPNPVNARKIYKRDHNNVNDTIMDDIYVYLVTQALNMLIV